MKTLLLSLTCVTGLVASAEAQVLQPQTARNILVGSIAGAIIGEHNDKPLQGAMIGAAAGALWSAVTVPQQQSYVPPAPVSYGRYENTYSSYGGYSNYGAPVCAPAPQPVYVAPTCVPVCPPTVVVRRPVVAVAPYCPPRVVVVPHGHHRDIVVVPHGHRRGVVSSPHGHGHRRDAGGHPGHSRRSKVVYAGPGY